MQPQSLPSRKQRKSSPRRRGTSSNSCKGVSPMQDPPNNASHRRRAAASERATSSSPRLLSTLTKTRPPGTKSCIGMATPRTAGLDTCPSSWVRLSDSRSRALAATNETTPGRQCRWKRSVAGGRYQLVSEEKGTVSSSRPVSLITGRNGVEIRMFHLCAERVMYSSQEGNAHKTWHQMLTYE